MGTGGGCPPWLAVGTPHPSALQQVLLPSFVPSSPPTFPATQRQELALSKPYLWGHPGKGLLGLQGQVEVEVTMENRSESGTAAPGVRQDQARIQEGAGPSAVWPLFPIYCASEKQSWVCCVISLSPPPHCSRNNHGAPRISGRRECGEVWR